MKTIAAIFTVMLLAAVTVSAQDQEGTETRRMPGGDGDLREKMQEHMKARRDGERGQGGGPGQAPGHNREEMMERLLNNPEISEKLGLTEETVEKIKDQLLKLKADTIELKAQMEKLGLEQARAMTAKEIDKEKLMALVDELGLIRTKIAKIQIEKMLVFRDNIDPQKMEEIRGKIMERMQRREGGENPEGMQRSPDGGSSEGRKPGGRLEEFRRKRSGSEETQPPPPPPLEMM